MKHGVIEKLSVVSWKQLSCWCWWTVGSESVSLCLLIDPYRFFITHSLVRATVCSQNVPRKLCCNESPRPSEKVSDELCHSLSVVLSNTRLAQRRLVSKQSRNAFGAITRIGPLIIITFGTKILWYTTVLYLALELVLVRCEDIVKSGTVPKHKFANDTVTSIVLQLVPSLDQHTITFGARPSDDITFGAGLNDSTIIGASDAEFDPENPRHCQTQEDSYLKTHGTARHWIRPLKPTAQTRQQDVVNFEPEG